MVDIWLMMIYNDLVGGFKWLTYPSEKYDSVGIIIPNTRENKKCSKPPPRPFPPRDLAITVALGGATRVAPPFVSQAESKTLPGPCWQTSVVQGGPQLAGKCLKLDVENPWFGKTIYKWRVFHI